jgi:hypothetical protein
MVADVGALRHSVAHPAIRETELASSRLVSVGHPDVFDDAAQFELAALSARELGLSVVPLARNSLRREFRHQRRAFRARQRLRATPGKMITEAARRLTVPLLSTFNP